MTRFAHLAQRLFNRPLAIHPDKAEMLVAALADRLGIAHLRIVTEAGERVLQAAELSAMQAGSLSEPARERKFYDLVDGVALIPVEGTLVHKLGSLNPWSGMTGYDGTRTKIVAALADPDVRGILFDVDSYGGEVSGCFDLVDTIHAARGVEPIRAILTETACSAAYAIASAADEISMPRTGSAGSIGVICMHVDWSRAMDKDGVTVTLVHAGAHKADGNPYQPLPDEVRKRWQAEIDAVGDLFAGTVARNRGLKKSAVLATEALTYPGESALAVGLVDRIESPDAAFGRFLEELASPAAAPAS